MSSTLIKINHLAIKKQQAKEAFGLYKKLSRIDDTIDCFDTIDQRLFKSWSEALLQPLENKTEALSRDLNELTKKHDHITAISELDGITYVGAYKIHQDEEALLLNATDTEKNQILKLREIRERYLKIKEQSILLKDVSTSDTFTDQTRSKSQTNDNSQDVCDKYLHTMAQTEKIFSMRFADVLHLKIEEVDWSNYFQASRFLSVLIERARVSGIEQDWKAYFSATALAPKAFHKRFKKYLSDTYNIANELDLLDMQERSYANRKEVYNSQLSQGLSPEDDEALKLIYRKLARSLHPDKNSTTINSSNIDRASLWQQTQEAYQQKDKQQLEHLEKYLCLLSGDLDHLNANDFHKLSTFLERQLFYRRLKNKKLRKKLAWGFSRKKSLHNLEKKLKTPYLEEIKTLENEIQHLRQKFTICEASSVQLTFQFTT